MPARHLYIHIPFCTRRCSYCDFSIAVRRVVPVAEYLRGLELELSLTPPGAVAGLDTVYLGGGTPSRLGPEGIARVLELVREHFSIADGAEITIEANPEDVSLEAASAWRGAGVNRLSLGVQSFNDDVLQWMHRVHDSAQAIASVHAAKLAGLLNISLDLIFALPSALSRSWKEDLETALSLGPSHISLYGLTVERGTPLDRWTDSGRSIPANEDTYAEEFLLAHAMTEAAGFHHYEVSNFARPGNVSRHNSAYWSGASYAGVGPSAHSFDGETRRWNVRAYRDWLARLETGQSPVEGSERLDGSNRSAERVYLGLRTSDGLEATPGDIELAKPWESHGWASIERDRVRLTPEGWLRLDSLAAGLTGF